MLQKPCGLISVVPPALQGEWAAALPAFLKRFRPAALVLPATHETATPALVAAAKPLEFAILFRDSVHDAKAFGADGVYLSGPRADTKSARPELGSAAIIGAGCGLSRHEAMEQAEAAADFITFQAS